MKFLTLTEAVHDWMTIAPEFRTEDALAKRLGLKAAMDWQTLSEKDCYDALYQIGGALRRMGKQDMALKSEDIANRLYPGRIKPAPIVPRTTT